MFDLSDEIEKALKAYSERSKDEIVQRFNQIGRVACELESEGITIDDFRGESIFRSLFAYPPGPWEAADRKIYLETIRRSDGVVFKSKGSDELEVLEAHLEHWRSL